MSDKTPKRTPQHSSSGYSPIILPESPAAASPQRNLTGTPRIARDLVADLYNNIQKWNDQHIKGANLVKQIASIKANSPNLYPENLEELITDLFYTVESLQSNKANFVSYTTQIRALVKLDKDCKPLFISLTVEELCNLFEAISQAYLREFQAKEFVLENICHCRNESEAMFLAAKWTYQLSITDEIVFKLETLLTETGHRKFV